jgi:EmrB/QacA subfamily drug resistance transporter
MFAAGTVIFTVGSLLCGLATGPLSLSLARAGQGIGGAVMFATSLALLSDAFRGRDRGVAFGVFGAVTGVAVAVGPVLGGVITSGLGWRWIFFVNVPVGIAALAITLTRVAESRDPDASRPDWLGFVTFSGALGLLVYGLISSGEGWQETKVVLSLVAAAALLAAFVTVELVQSRPMLDLSLFRKPTFIGGLIAAFAISASLFSLLTYLVLYLQNQLGLSPVATGVRFLVLTGAIFVTAGAAGRLTTLVPVGWMIGSGFALIGIGLLAMRGVTVTSDWTHLVPGLLLAGVGAGLVNVPLASTAVGVVEPARAGMASGINSTLRQVGIATGIAALGSLFTARLRDTAAHELALTPLGSQAHQIASGLGGTPGSGALNGVPPAAQRLVGDAARTGFVDGLNHILLIGAVIALAAAVTSVLLIRARDFVGDGRPGEAAPADAQTTPAAALQ